MFVVSLTSNFSKRFKTKIKYKTRCGEGAEAAGKASAQNGQPGFRRLRGFLFIDDPQQAAPDLPPRFPPPERS